MKYIAAFELEKREIKADYRRIFISFFKKAITDYMEGHFYDSLYNSGANKKSLVWSIRFSEPKFQGGMINLKDNKVILTFKSNDMETSLIYYSSLLGMRNKEFMISSDNFMILKSVKLVRELEIVEDMAVFKIFSPICLREHDREKNKDWYFSYGDERFKEALCNSFKSDLSNFTREIDELEFDFSGLKKIVVSAFKQKIPATIGTFVVKGDKRILNHILHSGIGSRRNAGFGLVERIII